MRQTAEPRFQIRRRFTLGQDKINLIPRNLGLALVLMCVACGGNPVTPDTRGGIEGVIVDCPTPVSGALICTARATCALYPCPGLPSDVTAAATWASDDPGVVALTTAGTFQRVGIGNTVIRADWHFDESWRPVSVFANTPPLPTFEIAGNVYRKGMTPSAGAIRCRRHYSRRYPCRSAGDYGRCAVTAARFLAKRCHSAAAIGCSAFRQAFTGFG